MFSTLSITSILSDIFIVATIAIPAGATVSLPIEPQTKAKK